MSQDQPSSLSCGRLFIPVPCLKDKKLTPFEECVSYLGDVGALIFFAHSALRSESITKELDCTLQLQKAILSQPSEYRQPRFSHALKSMLAPNPAITRQQISKWKSGKPFSLDAPEPAKTGLVYRLLNVHVSGSGETGSQWKGNAVFIIEMSTGTFIFNYINAEDEIGIALNQMLNIIHKADNMICKKIRKKTKLYLRREIWMPNYFSDDEIEGCNIEFKKIINPNLNKPVPDSEDLCNSIGVYDGLIKNSEKVSTRRTIEKLANRKGFLYERINAEYVANVRAVKFNTSALASMTVIKESPKYVIESGIQFAESVKRIFGEMSKIYENHQDSKKTTRKDLMVNGYVSCIVL